MKTWTRDKPAQFGVASVKPVPRRVSCTYAEAVYFCAAAFNNTTNSYDTRATIVAMLAAMYGRTAAMVGEHLGRGYV